MLLTTHFMEEGDRCDRLVLLDRGTIVAEGTPAALKEEIGGDVVTLTGPDPEALARDLAARFPGAGPGGAGRRRAPGAGAGHERVARLAEALPGRIEAVTVARPTPGGRLPPPHRPPLYGEPTRRRRPDGLAVCDPLAPGADAVLPPAQPHRGRGRHAAALLAVLGSGLSGSFRLPGGRRGSATSSTSSPARSSWCCSSPPSSPTSR